MCYGRSMRHENDKERMEKYNESLMGEEEIGRGYIKSYDRM